MRKVETLEELGITKNDKILAVFAHPDDESVYAGGLLHLLAKEGVQVNVIILTKGERSTLRYGLSDLDQLSEVRTNEFHKAIEILGITTCNVEDFNDGGLMQTKDSLLHFLENQIEIFNPTVLLTLEPSGIYGHPDHMAVSAIVEQVARSHVIPALFATVVGEVYKPSAAARKMAHTDHSFDPLPPELQLVFSDEVANLKLQAIRAHASQHIIDNEFMQKWGERMLLTSEFYTFGK